MARAPLNEIQARALRIATANSACRVSPCDSLPGAGSVPGAAIASFAVEIDGDHTAALREHRVPIIARVRDDTTMLDVRTIDPADDDIVIEALGSCTPRHTTR
jgi:L-seryl-tRNA(Ser) seleniumtransferase